MDVYTAYLTIFTVGPAIFLGLIRPAPSLDRFTMNTAAALGLIVAGALLWRHPGTASMAGALVCFWLGWVVAAAVVVQALWLRRARGRIRRWGAALGAMATVIPWFGLSVAIG